MREGKRVMRKGQGKKSDVSKVVHRRIGDCVKDGQQNGRSGLLSQNEKTKVSRVLRALRSTGSRDNQRCVDIDPIDY